MEGPKVVLVEWIGGTPEVFVPAAGVTAQRGGLPVEVPDEVAGREPDGDDPGEGLLAQPGNWRRASVGDDDGEG